ncbi:hypothetical protein [Nioella sediminis]|uniref:hypothetical protein n=1 Tax=Nioella sediminis TaxID=1912092 RepID=UPI000AF18B7A|nr:hypothetical protein [Nioella sediminis]
MKSDYEIVSIPGGKISPGALDVLILASGFEERAFRILCNSEFSSDAFCLLTLFDNDSEGNAEVAEKFVNCAKEKFKSERIRTCSLKLNEVYRYQAAVRKQILDLPSSCVNVWLDVSGFPAYAICIWLQELRDCRPYEDLHVTYTSALEYVPSFDEYQKMLKDDDLDRENTPPSMAKEMSVNMTFVPFSGHLNHEGRSCLALFSGYELHRSAGVIENINPTQLLLIYGDPSSPNLSWRLEYSQKLHERYEKTRKSASAIVPTHSIEESMALLEEYYHYLIDDFDFIVSPVCSKMHTVASFLFWEKHQEVQLTFPLPIGYKSDVKPIGCGDTLHVKLPNRVRFT